MSDIEWSPWIRHVGEECPDGIADIKTCVRLANGGEDKTGLSFGTKWMWNQDAGDGKITHYRIPMSDYKRITGMPEWSEAPEWATHRAQNGDGQWCFMKGTVEPAPESSPVWFTCDEAGHEAGKGTVLGDWRDTLQERPKEEMRVIVIAEEDSVPVYSDGEIIGCSVGVRVGATMGSHPNSEPDADRYSVGADASPQDARDELLKRAQERSLDPYDAPGFLEAALGHMEDRKSTYDAPEGERSMGKTVTAFNAITGRDLSEEEGWLMMVLLKAVRTQQGDFRADNYEDGAAYFALQGEAAARDRGHGQ